MIELGKNLRIRKLNDYNLVVEISHITKKSGKPRWTIKGYHSCLENALYSIIDKELFSMINTADTKVELLRVFEEITKLKASIHEILKANK